MQETQLEPNNSCLEKSGPFHFVTRRVLRAPDGSEEHWHARNHRKGLKRIPTLGDLGFALLRYLWDPVRLNWWIGGLFALGASFFAFASLLSLLPNLAAEWRMESNVLNAIFFAGSVPFTLAAYLQLLQAANQHSSQDGDANDSVPLQFVGWQPENVGWLSCVFQFVGTVLFNLNTLDAMLPSLSWIEYDLAVWIPNIVGSILFMASGYLAFIEVCHHTWAWHPKSISWWVVFVNLLGCVAFLISGVASIVLPGLPDFAEPALVCTFVGAVCFLGSSLLMLIESAEGID